jgi:hypothetical protein
VSWRDIGTPASSDRSGLRRPRSQNPPSAAGQRLRGVREQARGDLRGVHPDQHHGQRQPGVGVRERGRQPLVEPAAALPDHVEPGRQPVPRRAVEREHVPGHPGRRGRCQGVGERPLRE